MSFDLVAAAAAARVSGQVVNLERGDYPISSPIVGNDVHLVCRDGGARIYPAPDFAGRALVVGSGTTVRGTLLRGLVLDTEGALQADGSPLHAIDTDRTVIVADRTTARGPVRIAEHGLSTWDRGSIQSPGTPYALLLDDAYLGLSAAVVSGTIRGRGRLGGGGAGLYTDDRCVMERGHGFVAIDIASDDGSGFRADIAGRIEGGRIRIGANGMARFAPTFRHVGDVVAELVHWTAYITAPKGALSSGGEVVVLPTGVAVEPDGSLTPTSKLADAIAAHGLIDGAVLEGSLRRGMWMRKGWSVRISTPTDAQLTAWGHPPMADP